MFGRNSAVYKAWKKEWDRYKTIPNEIEVANLGSTCDANNFDYSYWNIVGFNFASSPQDMYYDNQLLKQYCYRLKKGATVFISISEFAFLVDKYEMDYRNYIYYGFLKPQRIANFSKVKKFIIKNCPGLIYKKCIKQEIKGFAKKILMYGKRKKQVSLSLKDSSQQMMSNWRCEFGWEKQYILTDKQKESISKSWDIFIDDIEFCNKNEIIPIIVIPPFNCHLKELMPKEILDECLWTYIDRIMNMGIKIISFWDDPDLENDIYYRTPICLNEDGKILFNKKIQNKAFEIGDEHGYTE